MMAHTNANALRKAFRGLHSDMQRSFAECSSSKFVKKTVRITTSRNLPLPADMREQLLSSGGSRSTKNTYFPEEIQDHILNEPSTATTYQFNEHTEGEQEPGRAREARVCAHTPGFSARPNRVLVHAEHLHIHDRL